MSIERIHRVVVLGLLLASPASAQTVDQSEESIAYLRQTACVDSTGVTPVFSPPLADQPWACLQNADCTAPNATCQHASVVLGKAALWPALEFPPEPVGGSGEGILRYVPLCDDGSGDHEYSMTGGLAGKPPSCLPEDYIRCADGVRPWYRIAPAVTGLVDDRWLIHAGGGGHSSAPSLSVPNSDESLWAFAHASDAGAYSVDAMPALYGNLKGVFDSGSVFASYNRIWIEKCTPDTWLGNKAHHNLQDYTVAAPVDVVRGPCVDDNRDGTVNCADDSCYCPTVQLEPPRSPNHEYSVYYHGKRIVRAVLSEVAGGVIAWQTYPLTVDASGLVIDATAVELDPPSAGATMAIHCHSNGCNGLQGGHIDELATGIAQVLGGGVTVRALFNSYFPPVAEVELAIDERGGPLVNGLAHIDDFREVYEQNLDPTAMTLQPVTRSAYQTGGAVASSLTDWYDPVPGYAPPVDASCLAHHCAGQAWTSAACALCKDSGHVLLNHLQTPFFYNAAQTDRIISRSEVKHCADGPQSTHERCDMTGSVLGADLVDSHYRQAVRKQLADLYRYGDVFRCEALAGPGAYDHIALVSPDWADHGPLSEDDVAQLELDLGGLGALGLADYAFKFVEATVRSRELCLEERTPGENGEFLPGGSVPSCD